MPCQSDGACQEGCFPLIGFHACSSRLPTALEVRQLRRGAERWRWKEKKVRVIKNSKTEVLVDVYTIINNKATSLEEERRHFDLLSVDLNLPFLSRIVKLSDVCHSVHQIGPDWAMITNSFPSYPLSYLNTVVPRWGWHVLFFFFILSEMSQHLRMNWNTFSYLSSSATIWSKCPILWFMTHSTFPSALVTLCSVRISEH